MKGANFAWRSRETVISAGELCDILAVRIGLERAPLIEPKREIDNGKDRSLLKGSYLFAMMMSSFSVRRLLLLLAAAFLTLMRSIQGQEILGDNFDTDSNVAWTEDYVIGHGQLARTNRHLEYRVSSPDRINGDEAYRPWAQSQPTYATSWEVVADVHNAATPSALNQLATFGIEVFDSNNTGNYAYVELYASRLNSSSLRRGFKADLALDETELGENTPVGDTGHLGITDGAVRLAFDSRTKVLTAWFDRDGNSNGYRWERLASFGIAGGGGSTTNANWGLTESDTLSVTLYGYSQGMAVGSGQIYGDDFFMQTAATDRPTLGVRSVPGGVQLRWLASAIGYQLQISTMLAPVSWIFATQIPIRVNGTNVVEVPLESPTQFYRLTK